MLCVYVDGGAEGQPVVQGTPLAVMDMIAIASAAAAAAVGIVGSGSGAPCMAGSEDEVKAGIPAGPEVKGVIPAAPCPILDDAVGRKASGHN